MQCRPLDLRIVQMNRQGVQLALDWARKEGWNPGIHDAACFFAADPCGFFAAKIKNEIVGTVSIVKYSSDFAFEGLLIVKPEFRGRGVGLSLQNFVMEKFGSIQVGLDGVLSMEKKYARFGFGFSYKSTRYTGIAKIREPCDQCIPISCTDFDEVVFFDSRFFPAQRRRFLEGWLFQEDSQAFMMRGNDGEICGYGVIRNCVRGHKIGPLFARSPKVAEGLFSALTSSVSGQEIMLDVPDPNGFALKLVSQNGMRPVFSTVRMYTKAHPVLPLQNIYGVASFELG